MYTELRQRGVIERFLRRDSHLHLYAVGDLDDFFWPRTKWYAATVGQEPRAVVLRYETGGVPVILAFAGTEADESERMARLLGAVWKELPAKVYVHASPHLRDAIAVSARITGERELWRMAWDGVARDAPVPAGGEVRRLTPADGAATAAFLDAAYPGNWLDVRMLETGQYFAAYEGGQMVAAAGVHVYSATYRVAAIGNVATHSDHRGRGYAGAVTAALLASLARTTEHVGLNVLTDNAAAIRCYERLGFRRHARFLEFYAEAKGGR